MEILRISNFDPYKYIQREHKKTLFITREETVVCGHIRFDCSMSSVSIQTPKLQMLMV
jgi:hypothetical protein